MPRPGSRSVERHKDRVASKPSSKLLAGRVRTSSRAGVAKLDMRWGGGGELVREPSSLGEKPAAAAAGQALSTSFFAVSGPLPRSETRRARRSRVSGARAGSGLRGGRPSQDRQGRHPSVPSEEIVTTPRRFEFARLPSPLPSLRPAAPKAKATPALSVVRRRFFFSRARARAGTLPRSADARTPRAGESKRAQKRNSRRNEGKF